MERVVSGGNNKKPENAALNRLEIDSMQSYEKTQESLYKKFNNAALNRMLIPVNLSQKSQYIKGDETETLIDNVLSRTLINSSTQPEIRSITNLDGFSNSHSRKQSSKRKRTEIKKFDVNGQTWTQIPSEKWRLADKNEYGDDTNAESKKPDLQLTEELEQHFIGKLNRNIKTKRSGTSTSTLPLSTTSKASHDFIDIDSFFSKKVEGKIELEETFKDKPKDFKKIVRDYASFTKNEEFDREEFNFCEKMVNLKRRENVGDILYQGKYIGPSSTKNLNSGPEYQKEKRNVDTVGFFIKTQTSVENIIQGRMNLSKTLNQPKVAKPQQLNSLMSPFISPRKMLTDSFRNTFLESPLKKPTDGFEAESPNSDKKKLSTILLKHRNVLGLKTVASVVKENAKKMTKDGRPEPKVDSTIATDAVVEEDNPKHQEENWKRINLMVKDRLTGMMEDIEKDLKQEEYVKGRIQNNLPVFKEKKQKQKLLKNLDDLANSTRLLAVKRDATKKTLNFAELVRIQGKIKAEEKRKERADRRKTIFSNRIQFGAEYDSPLISISKNE